MRAAAVLLATLAIAGCTNVPDDARIVRFDAGGRVQIGIHSGRGRPLLVLLHGRSSSPQAFFSYGLMHALDRLGSRAPNVVLVSGGDHSYYHDRRDGRWGTYVLRTVIPAAARKLGADPRRIAIGGVSMGGFGALDLARIAPHRFCAVGGHSAALWRTARETPAGAFDDAGDFARHNVFYSPFAYRGPLWIDVGTSDPFYGADLDWARSHRAELHVWPGGHGASYWRRHMDAYVAFYVTSCPSAPSSNTSRLLARHHAAP